MIKTTLQILMLACMAFGLNIKAGAQSGKVIYSELVRLDIDLGEEDDPRLKELQNLIPSEKNSEKELLFDGDQSLFRTLNSQDEETERSSSSGVVIMRLSSGGGEDMVYTKGDQLIEQKEFMGKSFLIEDDTKQFAWKFTGESRQILGYACQKAEFADGDRKDIAWFTTEITTSFGPAGYGSLPGLILAMELDNGKISYEATEVDLSFSPDEMEIPQKGKRVDREEFREIVRVKTEEIQQAYRGSGNRVIRIESR